MTYKMQFSVSPTSSLKIYFNNVLNGLMVFYYIFLIELLLTYNIILGSQITHYSYYNITDHISHTIHYMPVTYSFYSYKINGSFSSLIFFSFFAQLKIPIAQEPPLFFFSQPVSLFHLVIFICALSLIPQMMKTYTMVSV